MKSTDALSNWAMLHRVYLALHPVCSRVDAFRRLSRSSLVADERESCWSVRGIDLPMMSAYTFNYAFYDILQTTISGRACFVEFELLKRGAVL